MALDEALLDAHLAGTSPPTLRLYGFAPPAVTIGYGQRLAGSAIETIRRRGMDVAKRPTGGRAVLHLHDLTYSFIGASATTGDAGESAAGALSPSISGAYKQICAGLLEGLKLLGVEAELGLSNSPYKDMHDCFLATTTADLHYRGLKLVGSAQLRRKHGVLQHGSILLEQDQDAMDSLLNAKPAGGQIRHANLFEAAKRRFTMDELQDAFKKGFEKAFQTIFIEDQPSTQELSAAEQSLESFRIEAAFGR